MFKIIIKNLWNRRRRNIWLFIELIVVTILTWAVLDPMIVGFHNACTPLGYDADRLVVVEIKNYPHDSKKCDSESFFNEEKRMENYEILKEKARNLPDVESVSHIFSTFNGSGYSYGHLNTGNIGIDTIAGYSYDMTYFVGDKFFSTHGIEAAEGSPSIEQLESMILSKNDMIITETIDRTYWPDRRGLKDKWFIDKDWETGDTIYKNVVGIVKDVKQYSHIQTAAVSFSPMECTPRIVVNGCRFVLRLREGVDTREYVRDNIKLINDELQVGNFYVRSVSSQADVIKLYEDRWGVTSQRNLSIFVAVLFLVNLILGVTGCVWLQTGKRVSELGILRSYGASRSSIMRMLFGEGIVLATVAFVIGDAVYLQYALKEGLAMGFLNTAEFIPIKSWVTEFAAHFVIVSAIIYALVILCVCIGTYCPARHASRIEPVDALRDE